MKQIFQDGFMAYFASLWNWVDIAMLNMLTCSLILDLVVLSKVQNAKLYFEQNELCSALADGDEEALMEYYWLQRGDSKLPVNVMFRDL